MIIDLAGHGLWFAPEGTPLPMGESMVGWVEIGHLDATGYGFREFVAEVYAIPHVRLRSCQ